MPLKASASIQIQYFLKKYDGGNEMYLAKDLIENPVTNPKYVYCERASIQKNCSPLNIVPYVTDFQVILRDVEVNPDISRDPLIVLKLNSKAANWFI